MIGREADTNNGVIIKIVLQFYQSAHVIMMKLLSSFFDEFKAIN